MMDQLGSFGEMQLEGDGVPMYTKNGRALSADERAAIAKRRGQCVRCGAKTHKGSLIRKIPITNDEIWQGFCIRCNPESVPQNVFEAWESKHSRQQKLKSIAQIARLSSNGVKRSVADPKMISTSETNPATPLVRRKTHHRRSHQERPMTPTQKRKVRRPRQMSLGGSSNAAAFHSSNSGDFGSFYSDETVNSSTRQNHEDDIEAKGNRVNSLNQVPSPPIPHPPRSMSSPRATKPQRRDNSSRSSRSTDWQSTHSSNSLDTSLVASHHSAQYGGTIKSSSTQDSELSLEKSLEQSLEQALNSSKASFSSWDVGPDDLDIASEDVAGGQWDGREGDLIRELTSPRTDPNDLVKYLHYLRNSEKEDWKILSIRDTIIPFLQENIGNHRIAALACGVIWRFSCGRNQRLLQELADGYVVSVIIEVLREHDESEEACMWIIGALMSLTRDIERVDSFIRFQGVETLSVCLEMHSLNNSIVQLSCWSILNLLVQGFENDSGEIYASHNKTAPLLLTHSLVPKVLNCVDRNSPVDRTTAVVALLSAMMDLSDEVSAQELRNSIWNSQLPDVILMLFEQRAFSAEFFKSTSNLLESIIEYEDLNNAIVEKLSQYVAEVVSTMSEYKGDRLLLKAASSLLVTLIHRIHGQLFIQLVHVEVLLDLVERFALDIEISEPCCWVLSQVPISDDVSNGNIGGRGLQAMSIASDAHPESDILLLSVFSFASNLCSRRNVTGVDFPIQTIGRALLFGQNGSTVLEDLAAKLLLNIGSSSLRGFDEVSENLDIHKLVRGMTECSLKGKGDLCDLLVCVARQSATARDTILSKGFHVTAFRVIRDLDSEARIVRAMLNLLCILSAAENQLPFDVPQDLVGVILDISACVHAEDLQVAALEAVHNILITKFSSLPLEGLPERVLLVLGNEENSVVVRAAACGILWAFFENCPFNANYSVWSLFRPVIRTLVAANESSTSFADGVIGAQLASALACITERLADVSPQIETSDIDAVITSIYRALECSGAAEEALYSFLHAVSNLCCIDRDAMIESGVIVAVIDVMVEHEHSAIIQEVGCRLLATLSSSGDRQVIYSIVQTGGTEVIVTALANFSTNDIVQKEVFHAISHICIDENSRLQVVSQGGIHLIVMAISNHQGNEDMLQNACSAMSSLAVGIEEQMLAPTGVLGAMIKTVNSHLESSELQEICLAVMIKIAYGIETAKESIVEDGGISAVFSVLEHHIESQAIAALSFKLLACLATHVHGTEEMRFDLIVNGMLLCIEDESVQMYGCECLAALAFNHENKAKIEQMGGIDAIMFAMSAHFSSETVQKEACRALAYLFVDNRDVRVSMNEVDKIVYAMRRYPTSEVLQAFACNALTVAVSAAGVESIESEKKELLRCTLSHAKTRFPSSCRNEAQYVLDQLA